MMIAAVGIIAALFMGWVISGYLPTRNIQTPPYKVIKRSRQYEIRRYESYIVAETRQKGNQKESLEGGFRELFQYISGNNISRSKVTMTAPVLQSPEAGGEKIPMTAPVIKEGASTIAFVMPPGSKLEDLPQPKSKNVSLKLVPPHTVAAITFSGYPTEEKIKEKTEKLLSALKRDGIRTEGAPQIALYNPPWTPPFMRRNEVMAPVGMEAVVEDP